MSPFCQHSRSVQLPWSRQLSWGAACERTSANSGSFPPGNNPSKAGPKILSRRAARATTTSQRNQQTGARNEINRRMAGKQIALSSNQINSDYRYDEQGSEVRPWHGVQYLADLTLWDTTVRDGRAAHAITSILGVTLRQQVNGDQVRMDNLIRSSWEVASLRGE